MEAASATKEVDSVVVPLITARTASVGDHPEVDLVADLAEALAGLREEVLVGMVHLEADSAAAVAAADIVGTSSAKGLVGMMTGTSSVRATSFFTSSSRFLLPQTQTFCTALAMVVGRWFVPVSVICFRLLSILLPSQLLV